MFYPKKKSTFSKDIESNGHELYKVCEREEINEYTGEK